MNETDQKDLLKVMTYSTALAFGGLAAFLCSFRDIRNDPTLEFSYKTVVAFVAGVVIGILFWKAVEYLARKNQG